MGDGTMNVRGVKVMQWLIGYLNIHLIMIILISKPIVFERKRNSVTTMDDVWKKILDFWCGVYFQSNSHLKKLYETTHFSYF